MADTITYEVSVDGESPVDVGTSKSYDVSSLSYGDHVISVTGTCLHGNTSTDSKTIHIPGYEYSTSGPLFIPFIAKGAHIQRAKLWMRYQMSGSDPTIYIGETKEGGVYYGHGSTDVHFTTEAQTLKGETGTISAYMYTITADGMTSSTLTVGNQYYFSFEIPYDAGGHYGSALIQEIGTTQTCWKFTGQAWEYQEASNVGPNTLSDRTTGIIKLEIEYT